MSEDDWGAMIDVLQAMKRGLVGSVVTPKKKKSARSKLQPSYQRADFLHDLGKASRKLEPEGQLPKKKRPSERSGEKS